MGYINVKKSEKVESHLNWMGGKSFDLKNPVAKLRMAASSCFFGEPQYYHKDSNDNRYKCAMPPYSASASLTSSQLDYLRRTLDAQDPKEWRSMTPAQMMENAIDESLKADPEATLVEAARLRNEDFIRTTPQVILVRAANMPEIKHTGLVRQYAKEIIKRADEPAVGLAYQLSTYGEKAPIPNSLKKAWRDALCRFDEYQLGKYKMENRDVKLVDVVNLVHPNSDAVNKLANGLLTNTGKTWEAIISAKGSAAESWSEAIKVMGHMAMLRNIRNFLKVGLKPDDFIGKLVSGAKYGKQLPFRYYSAYNSVKVGSPPEVLDAIEDCLMISVNNMPKFSGKTMSLCDNSGSAWGTMTSSAGTMTIANIANLTGVLAGMVSDSGYLGVFGDNLKTMPIRKRSSVFDQLNTASKVGQTVGGGTENGIWLFWRDAINKKEHWDNVFIFSDMQAGHGGLYGLNSAEYSDYIWPGRRMYSNAFIDVPKLINRYRAKVNKNVKVYLVQVAGYQDTLVPEFYKNTYILGGWGEGLFKFAHAMSNLPTQ
jgi:hypothetical protein